MWWKKTAAQSREVKVLPHLKFMRILCKLCGEVDAKIETEPANRRSIWSKKACTSNTAETG